MEIQNLATVIPVDDMKSAVESWTQILGVVPTFVDGVAWAQFDVGGRRIALAGSDRFADTAGLMLKVTDVKAARADLLAKGFQVKDIKEGAHELKCVARGPEGFPLVVYSPK